MCRLLAAFLNPLLKKRGKTMIIIKQRHKI